MTIGEEVTSRCRKMLTAAARRSDSTKQGTSLIALVFLFSILLSLCFPTSIEASSLGKEIELAVSSPFTDARTSNAIELTFTNHSGRTIVIPLCSRFGKGKGYNQQPSSHDVVAVFAQVNFRWLDAQNQELAHGIYEASGSPLRLAPKQSQSLLVPMAEHSIIGARQLEVQFDNRPVEEAVKSFNLFQFLPPGSDQYFVKEITIERTEPEGRKAR